MIPPHPQPAGAAAMLEHLTRRGWSPQLVSRLAQVDTNACHRPPVMSSRAASGMILSLAAEGWSPAPIAALFHRREEYVCAVLTVASGLQPFTHRPKTS
ncbi:hypothetical protein [Streptomyces sp. TBY4]|uniref:hypothetical protein n=1 Tax=Streptomyces sp. TBY4 TaxID=2962030 RepID=UPI0020B8D00E|nr:hypothetical protein [Streptomyces sp. TBY4]MCP3758902.1 hypothetical protein [Streptomyces sp. TBY4]